MIFIDVTVKKVVVVYETLLLFLMRKSNFCMKMYETTLPFINMTMFFWNLVLLVFASKSKTDCEESSTILFVAVICLIAGVIIWICLIFLVRCLPWMEHCIIPKNNSKTGETYIRNLIKIINELRKLDADESNFKPGEDQCCICLEVMKSDDKIIFLPCHNNHCMHFDCISQWMLKDSRCPMCKQEVTLDSVLDKQNGTSEKKNHTDNQLISSPK